MSAGPLTTQSAEIHTASVEIKTLTVSGKQVTQAVFKQLQASRLLNSDGSLNGTPWGRVNYHARALGCDEAMRDHLHVVWQRGSELRRSLVSPKENYAFEAHNYMVADMAMSEETQFWSREEFSPSKVWRQRKKLSSHGGRLAQLYVWGLADYPSVECWAYEPTAQEVRAARENATEYLAEMTIALAEEAASLQHVADMRAAKFAELGRLPQLFIAV